MLEKNEVISRTADFVKETLQSDASGHDWWHVYRVWSIAKRLSSEEQVDAFVVELAALLHDIADWKYHDGDLEAGPKKASVWLESLGVDKTVVDHVADIIRHISFKGASVATPMKSREGMLVQDADRLDGMGAIGIARCFAYGGSKGRMMHDPVMKPILHASFEAYKNSNGTSLNHFYEKLFLLKDRMNTDAARRIAEEKDAYMREFVRRFLDEWDSP